MKLEQARARSACSNLTQAVNERIERVYGTREHYEAKRRALGMSDDHAAQFERYGVVLQPKQIEFAVWARLADQLDMPNEIGMGGARGPGKSFAVFAQVGLDDCQRFPGIKVLYLRKTQKAVKEQLADLALAVFGHMPDVDIGSERIRFANGSVIVIGGYKDDAAALAYLGLEYDIIVVEEATQLSAATHARIRTSNRSSKVFDGVPFRPRRYYTTNPLGIGHAAFKKRFVDNERKRERGEPADPRQKFIFATVDDNVLINSEYVENLNELSGAEYRAYRLGDWDVSAGAYFDTWDAGVHVISPITDLSWMRSLWASMDYGYNHWNMVYLHGEDYDANIYTLDELGHRRRHPDEIAPDILAWLAQYGLAPTDLAYFLVGTDAFAQTGHARISIAEQYQAHGIPMSRAYMQPGSRVARALYVSKLLGRRDLDTGKWAVEPRWFVTSRCTRLIETIPYLERDPNNPEDFRKIDADDRGEGGDDAADGAFYGLYCPHVTTMT